MLRDQRTVLAVSSRIGGPYGIADVSLSLPAVVDASGVASIVELELSDPEISALRRSAEVLAAARASLG